MPALRAAMALSSAMKVRHSSLPVGCRHWNTVEVSCADGLFDTLD